MNYAGLIMLICAITSLGCAAQGRGVLDSAEWRVRDAAADSQLLPADKDGKVPSIKLELQRKDDPKAPVWTSSCTVVDTTGADRAVTLALCIPFKAKGGLWWDNPERTREISGDKPFINHVDVGVGATFMASRYPLAVVSVGDKSLCIAVPVDQARLVRLLYEPVSEELHAEFDFGLSRLPKHFPSRADATVMAYEVPSKWAFRQALDRYYELYPKAFERKTKKGGIWMPFCPLDRVVKPNDFGFAFREVAYGDWESVQLDEKNGVDSYVYVEPQTNWREFRGKGDKPYEKWMTELWEDALKGDRKAQANLTSGIEREDGRYDLYLEKVAYTEAAPFGVNCDPDVPTENWGGWPNKCQYEMEMLAKALGWADEPPVGLDGVYIDSMEGWGTIQNYNLNHWRTTRYPLSFDTATRKVCLLNFWGTHAFIKELSGKLHEKGMLLFGNDAFFRFWQLAPYVDIPGREYGWVENGKWTPVPDERFLFVRSMSAKKPYLLLMNNAFEDPSNMEEYFQRSMFYALYPSMFHGHSKIDDIAYFYNPEWYNRDRHLFVKYIPMIRKLDMAGWEPVPYAEASPAGIRIERYGSYVKKNLAFTIHNTGDKEQEVTISLLKNDLKLADKVSATEWISGKKVSVESDGNTVKIRLKMKANAYAAVGIEGK